MTLPDIINGTFESTGGFFILLSVVKLSRDKKVQGPLGSFGFLHGLGSVEFIFLSALGSVALVLGRNVPGVG